MDAATLADFCDHLAEPHPPTIADLQRDLNHDVDSAELFEDTLPALTELHELGISMALISNLATPYKITLSNLGLDHFFDCIVFSCDAGIAKPNPAIYQLAIHSLGIDANGAMMVGDKYRADVAGPMACGIRGLLIDRDGKTSGDSVLRSLTDVTSYLGS